MPPPFFPQPLTQRYAPTASLQAAPPSSQTPPFLLPAGRPSLAPLAQSHALLPTLTRPLSSLRPRPAGPSAPPPAPRCSAFPAAAPPASPRRAKGGGGGGGCGSSPGGGGGKDGGGIVGSVEMSARGPRPRAAWPEWAGVPMQARGGPWGRSCRCSPTAVSRGRLQPGVGPGGPVGLLPGILSAPGRGEQGWGRG